MKFLKIKSKNNLRVLSNFIDRLEKEKETFKYFDKREIEIVNDHEFTYLLFGIKDEIVAYGHIEKEDNLYWLGIVVPKEHQSKGYGVLMMTKLIEESRSLNIPKIILSVYKSNKKAINLYDKMGFSIFKEDKTNLFFEKLI